MKFKLIEDYTYNDLNEGEHSVPSYIKDKIRKTSTIELIDGSTYHHLKHKDVDDPLEIFAVINCDLQKSACIHKILHTMMSYGIQFQDFDDFIKDLKNTELVYVSYNRGKVEQLGSETINDAIKNNKHMV